MTLQSRNAVKILSQRNVIHLNKKIPKIKIFYRVIGIKGPKIWAMKRVSKLLLLIKMNFKNYKFTENVKNLSKSQSHIKSLIQAHIKRFISKEILCIDSIKIPQTFSKITLRTLQHSTNQNALTT